MEDQIKKIKSMVIQDLRIKDYMELADVLKRANCNLNFLYHDHFNSQIDCYKLECYLQYTDFSKCLPKKQEYEKVLEKSFRLFYRHETNFISEVEIVPIVEEILDGRALAPKYTKDSLLEILNQEKDILLKVSTEKSEIENMSTNEEYKRIHMEIVGVLEDIGITHVNVYDNLWEWFNYFKSQDLNTYQSCRNYLNTLYSPLYALLDKLVDTNKKNEVSQNISGKNTKKILSDYLKEHSGFDSLFGHIQVNVSETLGQGGNGIVYLGKYEKAKLAIKFLVEYDSKKLSRFKAEYLNVNLVRNKLKNIVNYVEYGELNVNDSTYPYIIMETYEMSLKSYRKSFSEIPFARVLDLFKTLCEALETFEEQNIIHRDLKPENILVDKQGNFYITDFGIAHFSGDVFPIKGLTQRGERLANFEFSAPEQIRGETLSFATDIYTLFQLIYWFVFGEINRGTGGKSLSEEYDNPQASYLDSLIHKGISNAPSDRYQNISEINADFDTMGFKEKEINPFDDMNILSEIVRSTVPEFYRTPAFTQNPHEIKTLIEKINSAKTDYPFLFSTGGLNNRIYNFIVLDNGNYLLNQREIHIKKIWGYIGDTTYNDILLIETSALEPYLIQGHEESYVAVIDNTDIIPMHKTASGFVRYKGEVISTDNLQIQERCIDDQDRIYAIGAYFQCSVIQKNDRYLDHIQKNKFLTERDIIQLRDDISRNRHPRILDYL